MRSYSQGLHLIDFYPVCEYLAAAAKGCADSNPEGWIEEQKKHLKNNEYQIVIDHLFPHREAEHVEESKAPVRAGHRYLINRTDQLTTKAH